MAVDLTALCLRSQAGDKVALDQLLRYMSKWLVDYLKKKPVQYPIAYELMDIVQTTLIAILTAVRDFDPSQGMQAKSWLWLCAKRQIKDIMRDLHREKRAANLRTISIYQPVDSIYEDTKTLEETLPDRNDVQATAVDNVATDSFLSKLDSRLTEIERRVLPYMLEGFQNKEIAAALNTNAKSVDNARQRIKKRLKKLLQEERGLTL